MHRFFSLPGDFHSESGLLKLILISPGSIMHVSSVHLASNTILVLLVMEDSGAVAVLLARTDLSLAFMTEPITLTAFQKLIG